MTRALKLLAVSLLAAGCTTTHFEGSYRTEPTETTYSERMRTLDEGSSWPLFWGLFPAGSYAADRELARFLRPDETVTHLEIRERTSVGGVFLWIVTLGLVTHHTIEVRGEVAVVSRPPAEPAAIHEKRPVEKERATTAPPPESSSDAYDRGYRAGYRERSTGETAEPEAEPTREYQQGFKEGLKDASH
jgi:hypothetical protein